MKPYNDHADRHGSTSLLSKVGEASLIIFVTLFIASLVGSVIWGNEGFDNLLASFF